MMLEKVNDVRKSQIFLCMTIQSNDEMFIYIVATIILASIASINVKIVRLNFAISKKFNHGNFNNVRCLLCVSGKSQSCNIVERTARLASKFSQSDRITAEHFLPIERQKYACSVDFLSRFFFNEKGEERDALYKHGHNAGRLSLHATRFG